MRTFALRLRQVRPLLLSLVLFAACLGLPTISAHGDPPQATQLAALDRLATESGAPWNVRWQQTTGAPTFLSGRSRPLTSPSAESALAFLNRHRALFRMKDAAHELQLLREEDDDLGMRHLRFQQCYRGLRVYNADLLVHLSHRGEATCINGRYWPDISLSTRPTLSARRALSVAWADIQGANCIREGPRPHLVVFPVDDGRDYRLAWRVEVFVEPPSGPACWEYLVDAHTGAVLQAFDTIKYQAHQGSGTGVLGDTKAPLDMYLYLGRYYLADATRNIWTYTANNDTSLPGKLVNDTGDFFTDAAAVDAHYYLGLVYDYYTTVHSLNIAASFKLRSTVHYSSGYNNAFWDGSQMVYGDGDGTTFLPLSGELDIVAHEATHAVDERTADLNYWFQSGALNESYSDVLACFIDTDNWLVGEDVYTPATPGDALRSLENPPLYDQPDHMDDYRSLPWWYDNGGVHINSGIPNKAGYLHSEGGFHRGVTVAGVGRDAAQFIWYRTLAVYLFPSAQFQDAADLTVTAAADLHGADSLQALSAWDAWNAVGITPTPPRPQPISEFPISTAPGPQTCPAVSGNTVVWTHAPYLFADTDIYGCDLSTGREFPVCTEYRDQVWPAISGNIVVWQDDRNLLNGYDIYGYDLSTGLEFPICTAPGDQMRPAISGTVVVWTDWRNWATSGYDIYGYDLSTGLEFPISTAPAPQEYATISGNTVVWIDFSTGPSWVYGYDLSDPGPFPVCPIAWWSGLRGPQLSISGDIVVWTEESPHDFDIYGFDLGAGSKLPICVGEDFQFGAVVSAGVVAHMVAAGSDPHTDLHGHHLATGSEFPICTAPRDQEDPALSGSLVVWTDHRSDPGDYSNLDIYGCRLPPPSG